MQNNCKRKQYSEYLHILAYHDEQKRNNRKNTGEYFKAKLLLPKHENQVVYSNKKLYDTRSVIIF